MFYISSSPFELVSAQPNTRGRGDKDAQMCPCGKAVEGIRHILGECEIYREERDALEMRKINECDMEKFGTLDSSDKRSES